MGRPTEISNRLVFGWVDPPRSRTVSFSDGSTHRDLEPSWCRPRRSARREQESHTQHASGDSAKLNDSAKRPGRTSAGADKSVRSEPKRDPRVPRGGAPWPAERPSAAPVAKPKRSEGAAQGAVRGGGRGDLPALRERRPKAAANTTAWGSRGFSPRSVSVGLGRSEQIEL
mgnify:CR=1 FL=1